MTKRSIQAGSTPTVIVRSGGDVLVKGWERDEILANTDGRWGLKVERRHDKTEVQIGNSGEVSVPIKSSVIVYGGKNAGVSQIQGSVTVYAGRDVSIREVHLLTHATAGGSMDFDCETVEGDPVKFTAGRDLRCRIRGLRDARFMVNDLGGYWVAVMGHGRVTIWLKAGGDVTLITDEEVTSASPHGLVGEIIKPGQTGAEGGEG